MPLHDGGGTRYTFTGQEIERETGDVTTTGLMNDGARMVDPALGRFLAADPAGQFHSPYVYAVNNPVSYVDPTGEFVAEAIIIASAAFAAYKSASAAHKQSDGDWAYTFYHGFSSAFRAASYAVAAGGPQSWQAATAQAIKAHSPRYETEIGSATIQVGSSVASGTDGWRLRASVRATVDLGEGGNSVGGIPLPTSTAEASNTQASNSDSPEEGAIGGRRSS